MITDANEAMSILKSWLELFNRYSDEIFGMRDRTQIDALGIQLQRMEPSATAYLVQILEDGGVTIGSFGVRQSIPYRNLLATAVMGGNNEETFNFADFKTPVNAVLNRALGIIETGLVPKRDPVLTIHDPELLKRCTDLLRAPGQFDRVGREATLILEDRLRTRISHERLIALIPDSARHSGENLANTLLAPNAPVLSISTDQRERAAFQKMMVGVFSYLRNPFHHHLDDTIEWSWAWSIVGLVDRLLFELEKCTEQK